MAIRPPTTEWKVNQMPETFEEFTAVVEREYDKTAEPMDYIRALHTILVNVTKTLEDVGKVPA